MRLSLCLPENPCEHKGGNSLKGRVMTEQIRRRARRVFVIALATGLMGSMMYVSFAFGFRAGIMEDTVYIMPQC